MNEIITSVQSFESLSEALRSGRACIPVVELNGHEFSPPFSFGSLVSEGERIELRVRSKPHASPGDLMDSLVRDQNSPPVEELHFLLDGKIWIKTSNIFCGSHSRTESGGVCWNFGIGGLSLRCDPQISEMASGIAVTSKIATTELHFKNLTSKTVNECSLEGVIGSRYNVDRFGGDFGSYRYIFQQKDEDVIVVLTLTEGGKSKSQKSDMLTWRALMLGFFWMNGGRTQEHYRLHERDLAVVEGVILSLEGSTKSIPYLVKTKFCYEQAFEIMDSCLQFFSLENDFSEGLALLLWHYRDATREGPITLGMLLQSCTLLEGLVGLVLRHSMNLDDAAINKLRMPGTEGDKKRKSHAVEKFWNAYHSLGFDWHSEIANVYDRWNGVRNALAHGDLAKFEKDNPADILEDYRAVVQAFNSLALRAIGYKGRVKIDREWYAVSY